MADTALTEWEGCWVSISVKGRLWGGYTGSITKVGNDGFIIQPQDSPDTHYRPSVTKATSASANFRCSGKRGVRSVRRFRAALR